MIDGKTARTGKVSRAVRVTLITAAAWLGVFGTTVFAQTEIDVEPPLIEHESIETGVAGESQEFTATVVDDRELAEVVLSYRFAGQESFENTPMQRVASSSVFTASVDTAEDDSRAIEYYIQASDKAGNGVFKGYAFSPLTRRLTGADGQPFADAGGDAPEAKSGGGRRWLYIGLGVLAAGALAAAAGGGDSEGGGGDPNTFDVIINPPR